MKYGVFLHFLPRNSLGQNLGQPSDPSRDPNADRFGKHPPDKLLRILKYDPILLVNRPPAIIVLKLREGRDLNGCI